MIESGERQLTLTLLAIGTAALLGLALALDRIDGATLRGIITGLVLAGLSIAAINHLDRRSGDGLGRIHLTGLALKFVGMGLRIFMLYGVYGGSGDARRYVTHGAEFMHHFRAGEFVTTVGMAGSEGTENIALLVGALFTITGESFLAGAVTWTLIAYWGQYLFTRALRRAVPGADHRRYTMLVLFFPTLWYWPSIVGKEALMIGGLGLAAYGASSLVGARAELRGLVPFITGTIVLGLIRPHMALITVVALATAAAVGSATRLRSLQDIRTSAVRILALILLVIAASYAATQVTTLVGGSDPNRSLTDVLETTADRTSTGGSEFRAHPLRRPSDLPAATVNVLLRPFPWEANHLQTLLAALEGVALTALVVTSRRRLLQLVKQLPRQPYLVYTAAYTFVFIGAFSYISNFGILARQRSQLLPLFFTLLALPVASNIRRRGTESDPRTQPAPPDQEVRSR